jgi:hypothetical protein
LTKIIIVRSKNKRCLFRVHGSGHGHSGPDPSGIGRPGQNILVFIKHRVFFWQFPTMTGFQQ